MDPLVPQLIVLISMTAIVGTATVRAQEPQSTDDSNSIVRNYVHIDRMPRYLQNKTRVKVSYYCEEDGVVALSVEAILRRSSIYKPIFSKAWKCKGQGFNGQVRRRFVRLRLPNNIMYRPDFFRTDSVEFSRCNVKVALHPMHEWLAHRAGGSKPRVKSRDFQRLESLPPLDRPYFKPACHIWIFPILQRSRRPSDSQKCAVEAERVVFLDYPAVFSGTTSGILRTLQPFSHPQLESNRLQRYTSPRMSLEVWVYIIDYCPLSHYNSMNGCGLLTHLDQMGQLLTPSLFINNVGQVQVDVTDDKTPIGIKTLASVPKHVWTRIVFTLEGRMWNLYVHYGPNMEEAFIAHYTYADNLHYNDTKGFFSIGGMEPLFGSFVGYVGKAVIYRRRIISPSELTRPDPFHPMFELHLMRRQEKCRNFLSWLDSAIGVYNGYTIVAKGDKTDVCQSVASRIQTTWSFGLNSQQCPLRHPHKRKFYRHVSRLLRKAMRTYRISRKFEGGDFEAYARSSETSGNRAAFVNVSKGLMDAALSIVAKRGLKKAKRMVPLLKQAACLGNDDAMFYLAVMLNNGVGVAQDELQSLAFFMLGALNKHSLSTMAMGHRHMMGIDGAPWDFDTAFMYYKTAAEKTKVDLDQHRDKEVLTEDIRLIDDSRMEAQTSEVGDIFLWLRNQAERGVASARAELASMLYWGARGIQRNLQNAMNVYRAGAEEGNPESMFNYGIMQYRGIGGKANETSGKALMKKAAELKDRNAINALGWIALTREGNMTEALRLFLLSKKLGHRDAGYYLGEMNYNGLVPNAPVNWDEAFVEYEWSAVRGHIHAGVMTAFLQSRGTPKYVRNVAYAADWARFVAEKNAALAQPLRDAVNAYRDGNTDLAMYLYLVIADTGFEVASFNLAYLCELNQDGATSYLAKECQWRHYNLTTQRTFQFVDAYSYIKMGDYHWYGCLGKRDLEKAAHFYGLAIVKKDPQALFNLAFMVEEGVAISPSVWQMAGVKPKALESNYSTLIELYSRCRESKKSEAFIPCTLALTRIYILNAWNDYYIYMQITSYFGVAVVIVTAFVLTYHYLQVRKERRRRLEEEAEDSRNEEMSRKEEGEGTITESVALEGGEEEEV